jgi:CRP-like cAMP-binding protein
MPLPPEALLALRRVVGSAGTIPEAQWLDFAAQFRLQHVEKNSHWLRAGEQATNLGFVVRGLFRLYYAREDGKQFNKSFVAEYEFLAGIHSLLERRSSRLSIEALTDSEILTVPYEAIQEFYERDMFWQRLGRLMAEHLVVKKLEREAALLMDSAAVRYESFLRDYSHIEGRIPDHHVARYLGITPEALSRLKRARVVGRRSG